LIYKEIFFENDNDNDNHREKNIDDGREGIIYRSLWPLNLMSFIGFRKKFLAKRSQSFIGFRKKFLAKRSL
jgi:hypothetical protein